MDYKEEYEKLKGLVKDLYPLMTEYCQEKVEGYFPEFKETDDELMLEAIIGYIDHDQHYGVSNKDMIAWLKKQGEINKRIQDEIEKQTKQQWKPENPDEQNPVWSDEDEEMRMDALKYLEIFDAQGIHGDAAWPCIEWLKSLKKRMQPQPKQEPYVDLGLPSGTLWKSANEEDYYTYDEATAKFSNKLPSRKQWDELTDKCKWEWKGAGYGITGPNGNTIYLPGDGYTLYDEVRGVGTYGGYWSSTCYDSDFAWYMCFGPGFIYTDYYKRNNGRSVRLVK